MHTLIYAMMNQAYNLGMLNMYSPEENSLKALLYDCIEKQKSSIWF